MGGKAFTAALAVLLGAVCLCGVHAAVVVNTHNGMTFFYNDPHKTVPRTATVASLETAEECICSDADPRSDDTLTVTYNCYHQALFGNCEAEFMKGALEELVESDGFCQMSCNNCTCCDSPYNVIEKTGNTRFLQAVEATNTTLERMLRAYGLTSTILVPSDAAFDAALAAYGPALRDAALLTEILKFHILPPEPRTRGLWTSPFLSVGATVYTLFDGVANLKTAKKALPAGTTAQGGLTGIVISGPVNSATVVESDIRACKTFITIIDEVLLPFDPTGIDASNDSGALGAALGAGTCSVVPNALINATTLVQGGSNPQASPAACCASCAANAECNTWSYCGLAGGCRFPEGLVIPYGSCELKRSAELAAGQAPIYGNSGIDVVPVLAGFNVPVPDSEAGAATAATAAPAGETLVGTAGR